MRQSFRRSTLKCFVISPIGKDDSKEREHADELFKYLIEPALAHFDIQAVRSDHMRNPGKISDQMYRAIFEYDLCIAVLTFSNPNVYYELAVAQSASRPVVVLVHKDTPLPFDVKDFRTLEYDLRISSYESRVHINALISALQTFKDNGWIGEDVFGAYRKQAATIAPVDVTQYGIRVTNPVQNAEVDILTVEGVFEKLPMDYELRSLRYYPDAHGFVPHGNVAVNHAKKTWKVSRFDVGGEPGDSRGVEIALAGPNARILLDYWQQAHVIHSFVMNQTRKLGVKGGKWLPAITHWPNDLLTCDRVEVKRKRKAASDDSDA